MMWIITISIGTLFILFISSPSYTGWTHGWQCEEWCFEHPGGYSCISEDWLHDKSLPERPYNWTSYGFDENQNIIIYNETGVALEADCVQFKWVKIRNENLPWRRLS